MVSQWEFEEFKRAVDYWVGALGLTDWTVEVRLEPLERSDYNTRARCYTNWTQRCAAIVLNSEWNPSGAQCITSESHERIALHEVLHLLLCSLVNVCAQQRDAYSEPSDAEEHAVLRRLMRVLPPVADVRPA